MKRFLCLLLALLLPLASVSCSIPSPRDVYYVAPVENVVLTACFLDVGQGDCTILESEGEFVLIDAGDDDHGDKVLAYLQSHGAEKLKYVIATHPHADHIGGMPAVISAIDTENFITVETDCSTYSWMRLLRTVDELDINYIDAAVGDVYTFGGSSFTILAPNSDGYDGYNNYSVVTKVQCGDIRILLTGDAEKESEYEMLDVGADTEADLLKCGHHGSYTSTSTRFLQAVNPMYAVISCGRHNEYGHPHRETRERLRLLGCEYFCTADQGTITAETDGTTLTVNTAYLRSPVSYKAGDERHDPDTLSFVGNKSSMYFHDPTCGGTKTMNPKNKVFFSTYEEALGAGYTPCPSCCP